MITENDYRFAIKMQVRLMHPDAKIPYRKRMTDAGYDLYSVEDKVLLPGRSVIVKTGICIAAPSGFYYTIDGRSSLWSQGIFPNRGIIDATFCGEVVVSLNNLSGNDFYIACGDRIAQIILHKQYHMEFEVVDQFSPEYAQRGLNGFGSSGGVACFEK